MTEAMRDYLSMGGYAPFIWPAYGVAAVILVAFAVDSWRRVHQATAALRRLEADAVLQARPAKSRSPRNELAGNGPAGNKTAGQAVPDQQASGQRTPDQQVGS
ncbi:MAG TPA: heme exporter protein CcmD [Dongiaceae bacterium]|nr:heme exporter protein CcmD [Dongiaceae bacterium]